MRSKRALWDALLASSRMPWAGGAPVEVDGRRYLDGGMASPIPVTEAIAAGATHVLALQTRPHGVPRKSASRIADRMIERHLRRLNPALVRLYRDRGARYEVLVGDIARRSLHPAADGPPYVLGVRPPAGTPCVGQLERRSAVLAAAAAQAERLVEHALSARAPGALLHISVHMTLMCSTGERYSLVGLRLDALTEAALDRLLGRLRQLLLRPR